MFLKLFHETHVSETNLGEDICLRKRHCSFNRRNSAKMVSEAVKKTKSRNNVGPHDIPIKM